MNKRKYFVFDFETDGPKPETCNPVQVAACVIDPIKLEVIPGSEFNTMMKPPGIDKNDDYLTDERLETIGWHARIQKTTTDAIITSWREAPSQDVTWSLFSNFVNRFNPGGTMWTAPVPGGANIGGFDIPIANKLNDKYNIKTMFFPRDCDMADVQRMAYHWFEGLSYGPANYKVDTLREFFQIDATNAHDALKDVQDCAELIIRFLTLSRHCASRVDKFKEYHEALKKSKKK